MHQRFYLWALVYIIFACCAEANEPANLKTELKWFDLNGNVLSIDWQTHTRWVWKPMPGAKSTANSPIDAPVLEIWIEYPANFGIIPNGDEWVHLEPARNAPVPERQRPDHAWLVIETRSPVTTKKLKRHNSAGIEEVFGLVATVLFERPSFLVHDSCAHHQLDLQSSEGTGNFLFAAAWCEVVGDTVAIYVLRSDDIQWREGGAQATDAQWKLLRKNVGSSSRWIGEVDFVSKADETPENFENLEGGKSIQVWGQNESREQLYRTSFQSGWRQTYKAKRAHTSLSAAIGAGISSQPSQYWMVDLSVVLDLGTLTSTTFLNELTTRVYSPEWAIGKFGLRAFSGLALWTVSIENTGPSFLTGPEFGLRVRSLNTPFSISGAFALLDDGTRLSFPERHLRIQVGYWLAPRKAEIFFALQNWSLFGVQKDRTREVAEFSLGLNVTL